MQPMNKSKKSDSSVLSGLKAVPPEPSQPVAQAPVVMASFSIAKLDNGSVTFNFGGPDSDVLGLIEFARMLTVERVRVNAAQALAQWAEKAAQDSEAVKAGASVPDSSA